MIFLDSGFILAYVNESDPRHSDALPLMKRILKGEFGKIFISDYIITEVSTLSRVRTKSCECAKSIDELLRSKKDNKDIFFCVYVDKAILDQTTVKFQTLCPNGLSHIDCSIVVIAEMFSISLIASFDSHFKGFLSVLP